MINIRIRLLAALVAVGLSVTPSLGADFKYCPPGDLLGSGEAGYSGRRVFAPKLTFPVLFDRTTQFVTLNSQVYNFGGICHDGDCSDWVNEGSQCNEQNYAQPWRDTFCEKGGRGYENGLCPDKLGHQGLDIRPPSFINKPKTHQCEASYWDAVSVVKGTVAKIQGAVVVIRSDDNVSYTYRHLDPKTIAVSVNEKVDPGDVVAKIANFNNAGTAAYTTVHLHLEARTPSGTGAVVVLPLYTSMIVAYRRAIGLSDALNGKGELEVTDNERLGC